MERSIPHYICTGGCKGVSDTAKSCEAPHCRHFQKPLEECFCKDDQHDGMLDMGTFYSTQ